MSQQTERKKKEENSTPLSRRVLKSKSDFGFPSLVSSCKETSQGQSAFDGGQGLYWDANQGLWRCVKADAHSDAIRSIAVQIQEQLQKEVLQPSQSVDVNWGFLTPIELKNKIQSCFGITITEAEGAALGEPFLTPLKDGTKLINGVQVLQKIFLIMAEDDLLKQKKQKEQEARIQAQHIELMKRKNERSLGWQVAQRAASADVPPTHIAQTDSKKAPREKALKKLEQAAFYHQKSPFDLKRIRDGGSMKPAEFQSQMLHIFGLHFDRFEVEALMEVFDANGDGSIDSAEFLSLFFRMADNNRKSRLERQRLHALQTKEKEEKINAQMRSLTEGQGTEFELQDFSEEDVENAVQKLAKVAADYDRNRMGPLHQLGFESKSMTPTEFRSQLRSVFKLKLSVREISALVRFMEKGMAGPKTVGVSSSSIPQSQEQEGLAYVPGKVDGSTFTVVFARLGQEERARRRRYQQKEREEKEYLQDDSPGLLSKGFKLVDGADLPSRTGSKEGKQDDSDSGMELEFTQEDVVNAEIKMRAKARVYDQRSLGPEVHAIQEGNSMTPRYFHKVMNRTFQMELTKSEGLALFSIFDADGGGDVDGAEFLSKFFKYHKEEQKKAKREEEEKQLHKIALAKEAKDRLLQEKREEFITEMSSFTRKDVKCAVEKISAAARNYDPARCNIDSFKGSGEMGPQEFKKELAGTFGMKVSNQELGVLFYMFDDDGGGTIERSEFMSLFFKLRRNDPDTIEVLEMMGHLEEDEVETIRSVIRDTFKVNSFSSGCISQTPSPIHSKFLLPTPSSKRLSPTGSVGKGRNSSCVFKLGIPESKLKSGKITNSEESEKGELLAQGQDTIENHQNQQLSCKQVRLNECVTSPKDSSLLIPLITCKHKEVLAGIDECSPKSSKAENGNVLDFPSEFEQKGNQATNQLNNKSKSINSQGTSFKLPRL